jgi:uncharacterized protein
MRAPEKLSLAAARRIALAAQGFGAARPEAVTLAHLRRTVGRLGLHQIDSVNVLVRAHYLPAFSRLGPYDRSLLDGDAWGPKRTRRLFEYWAHEASLLPLALHPLLRWRMDEADRGLRGWTRLKEFAHARRPEAEAILARIRADGPLAASDFEHGRSRSGPPSLQGSFGGQPPLEGWPASRSSKSGGWWEWGETKQALEFLFWAGHIATATRRGSFERVYDLTERVIPAPIRALPTPAPAEAHRRLIEHAARAHGVATAGDLRDYFRLKPDEAKPAIEALVEDGTLLPVVVEGWRQPAFLHAEARRPRRIRGQALLVPFDPLIWHRERTERLFGLRYRIEIYVPAEQRTHGYYVLPFLMDEAIVARVDLKSDRQGARLLVQQVGYEPGAPPETRERLSAELALMAAWLGLAPPAPLA